MRNAQRMLALGAMTLTAGAVFGMTATAASAATGQDDKASATQPGPIGPGPVGPGPVGPGPGPVGPGPGPVGPGPGPGPGPVGPGPGPVGPGPGGIWVGGPGGGPGGPWAGGHHNRHRAWVDGVYPTKRACNIAARIGERRGRFDRGVCVPSSRRGWLLIAHEYGWRDQH